MGEKLWTVHVSFCVLCAHALVLDLLRSHFPFWGLHETPTLEICWVHTPLWSNIKLFFCNFLSSCANWIDGEERRLQDRV